MSWIDKAICSRDKHSGHWTSYNLDKIEYAKRGCASCTVKKECMMNALSYVDNVTIFEHSIVGVIAGTSEFDRRMASWKRVNDINGNNWE